MAQEHSRSEKADCASLGEGTGGVPAFTDYHSALSQLNESDAFGGVREQSVDRTGEYFRHERPSSPGEKPEIVNVPAPAVGNDSALSLLNELCAPGEVRKQNVDMAYEDSRYEKAKFDSGSERTEIVPVGATPADYHAALLQIIEQAATDPRQLRRLVYEFARTNLKTETRPGSSALSPADIRECELALETAIARVEVGLSRGERTDFRLPGADTGRQPPDDGLTREEPADAEPRLVASNATRPTGAARPARLAANWPQPASPLQPPTWPRKQLVPRFDAAVSPRVDLGAVPAVRAPVEIVYPERDKTDAVRARRRVWLWFILWPLVQLIGPAIFCLVLYIAVVGKLDLQTAQTRQAIATGAQQSPPPVEAVRPSGLPLPSTYGVYAISNGRLSELEPLPIRAPDPRVQLSAEIKKPSSSVLPDGKIVFVLFRRELLNSAPQKLAIRIVARVARALTFSSGKAAALNPDASWHIRGNSYDFQVSPLNENREMVAARPEDPDFAFPSGRYALVFAGLAYDFTVEGPITAPAQCLESFEAVSGPVFTECRPK
jgi:hypothetical protein